MARFPALGVARAALEGSAARPAVLNAANEVAVGAFLEGRLGFLEIVAVVEKTLERYDPAAPVTLDEVFAIDGEARILASEGIEAFCR